MAVVTLTVAQLAAALRLGSSTEETDEATRLLAYSSEAVLRHAPECHRHGSKRGHNPLERIFV